MGRAFPLRYRCVTFSRPDRLRASPLGIQLANDTYRYRCIYRFETPVSWGSLVDIDGDRRNLPV